jgi:hypothetical protein
MRKKKKQFLISAVHESRSNSHLLCSLSRCVPMIHEVAFENGAMVLKS